MSYLSDKIVQNIARSTSFMSKNILDINTNNILDSDILENKNENITSKMLASNSDVSQSEILIGFDIKKIIGKLQDSISNTKEFVLDATDLIQTTNKLTNFLEKDAGKLHSSLLLFSQVIKNSAKQNINEQNVQNYKYMQETTDNVIQSLSNLMLKITEESDDISVVKNKLIKLIISINTFINIYKSMSHIFNNNYDYSIQKSKSELIEILTEINSNKEIVENYINTTSQLTDIIETLEYQEAKEHINKLYNNNNLYCSNNKYHQPSHNWQFIYELALNFKKDESYISDQYALFLMNKIKVNDIRIQDIKLKINNMQFLISKHIDLINKYKNSINEINKKNNSKMKILSNVIKEIKNNDNIKVSGLLSVLNLQVSNFSLINSVLKFSFSIITLSYDVIRMDNKLNFLFNKSFNYFNYLLNQISKIIIESLIKIFNFLYNLLSKILLIVFAVFAYIISVLFDASFSLFTLTVFPIIKPPYENLIKYSIMLSKFFNNNMFLFRL